MSTGKSARLASIGIGMLWMKHHKPMMDQCRMRRTEGIVLESVKIGQNVSEM